MHIKLLFLLYTNFWYDNEFKTVNSDVLNNILILDFKKFK